MMLDNAIGMLKSLRGLSMRLGIVLLLAIGMSACTTVTKGENQGLGNA